MNGPSGWSGVQRVPKAGHSNGLSAAGLRSPTRGSRPTGAGRAGPRSAITGGGVEPAEPLAEDQARVGDRRRGRARRRRPARTRRRSPRGPGGCRRGGRRGRTGSRRRDVPRSSWRTARAIASSRSTGPGPVTTTGDAEPFGRSARNRGGPSPRRPARRTSTARGAVVGVGQQRRDGRGEPEEGAEDRSGCRARAARPRPPPRRRPARSSRTRRRRRPPRGRGSSAPGPGRRAANRPRGRRPRAPGVEQGLAARPARDAEQVARRGDDHPRPAGDRDRPVDRLAPAWRRPGSPGRGPVPGPSGKSRSIPNRKRFWAWPPQTSSTVPGPARRPADSVRTRPARSAGRGTRPGISWDGPGSPRSPMRSRV